MAEYGTQFGDVREAKNAWVPDGDRAMLIAFITDAASEVTLRDGLSDATPHSFAIMRGGIRAAITAMQKTATPRSLIVDVSGEQEPLSALFDLSQVVEPDVHVLVVGEITSLDFYREVTRNMGAVEYLAKPLTRDNVLRLFAPVIVGQPTTIPELDGGRVITVTGARGGVGATSIAVSLAWHLASIEAGIRCWWTPTCKPAPRRFIWMHQPALAYARRLRCRTASTTCSSSAHRMCLRTACMCWLGRNH